MEVLSLVRGLVGSMGKRFLSHAAGLANTCDSSSSCISSSSVSLLFAQDVPPSPKLIVVSLPETKGATLEEIVRTFDGDEAIEELREVALGSQKTQRTEGVGKGEHVERIEEVRETI